MGFLVGLAGSHRPFGLEDELVVIPGVVGSGGGRSGGGSGGGRSEWGEVVRFVASLGVDACLARIAWDGVKDGGKALKGVAQTSRCEGFSFLFLLFLLFSLLFLLFVWFLCLGVFSVLLLFLVFCG